MKNNGTLFYWHLELLHHTLLHSFQEMMKGEVEQSGLFPSFQDLKCSATSANC